MRETLEYVLIALALTGLLNSLAIIVLAVTK